MEVKDLLTLYGGDSYLDIIISQIASKGEDAAHVQVKGLVGSLDAVISAAIQQKKKGPALYILSDREEAAYFQNDLQNLLGKTEVLFYPTSYKRPYQYEEVDNANVLMRGEILNKLNVAKPGAVQIVTYPEALFEKVISKRSLKANTFPVKVGEKLDPSFLTEFLLSYDFEITDFVFEAGQFSVRGGILDVFSFANEHPFRIELFGDEVESIRSFDPDTQLSIESAKQINIVPDIQKSWFMNRWSRFSTFSQPIQFCGLRMSNSHSKSLKSVLKKRKGLYRK